MASCHHHTIDDIETIHNKFRTIIEKQDTFFEDVPQHHEQAVLSFLQEVKAGAPVNDTKRKYGLPYKNSTLLRFAREHRIEGLEDTLRIVRGKSHSGVLVITIFTSAYPEYIDKDGVLHKQAFSCKWNCHYCPNQPGQPRSYLEGEPGVLRANSNEFDCCRQMWSRMDALYNTGHPIDKLEVLVLGGTWESYPLEYRNNFIRDIYYAANTFWQSPEEKRTKGSLPLERDGNRNALCKVIGLTLETRPDTVSIPMIKQLRYYGCTRVQMGIQHLDDAVLTLINRQCPTVKTIQAIKLLKEWGYKVDAHWMPNLPGCTPELDRAMFLDKLLKVKQPPWTVAPRVEGVDEWKIWFLEHPEYQVDQWKIYPCEVVPYTEIEKWYKAGTYIPYGQEELSELLMETKRSVFPWIRLNRVIRDIPSDYIMASGDHPSLRQELLAKMKKRGWKCNCIRCREIKNQQMPTQLVYRVHDYLGSDGVEYFIECTDTSGDILCGFLRLRIDDLAWIRELHVYGQLVKTTGSDRTPVVQSTGIGKKLVNIAISITKYNRKTLLSVIAGEGTKRYYEKLGFTEAAHGYMVMYNI